jgi:carbon storage regulator CsrA
MAGMLIIGLKPGEHIQIGDDIVIVIKRPDAYVKVGIKAPRHVKIKRVEDVPDSNNSGTAQPRAGDGHERLQHPRPAGAVGSERHEER